MSIIPILRALFARHKTAVSLIIFEIALTCAIVSNAVFLIGERIERIEMASGVAEDELVRVQITGIGRDVDPRAQTQEDLAALRAIPGVTAVEVTNQVPFGRSSWNSSILLDPDQRDSSASATMYLGGDEIVETLGLRLVAGRNFHEDEYLDYDADKGSQQMLQIDTVVITQALAERLFPDKRAVGETFYFSEESGVRVVGVVEQLVRPANVSLEANGSYAVIAPVRLPYTLGGNYLLRTEPHERARVLGAAVEALAQNGPSRIILNQDTLSEIRSEYFRADRSMAWLLVTVCVALLIVTALGIVGLASFWVQQRTRQIGVRRALGATHSQILRHFQIENLLITTLGIFVGMALAYGVNAWLMQRYELPRLPAMALPVGALTLWALGQVAVLGPALRAAAVPPAVATRSV